MIISSSIFFIFLVRVHFFCRIKLFARFLGTVFDTIGMQSCPDRHPDFVYCHALRQLDPSHRKGKWTQEEIEKLVAFVHRSLFSSLYSSFSLWYLIYLGILFCDIVASSFSLCV